MATQAEAAEHIDFSVRWLCELEKCSRAHKIDISPVL